MSLPLPGQPVRGSASGRPIMVLLDALGRRGALRIIWELRADPMTFRALQAACETNPALLNTRVKELRGLDVVQHADGGYRLTDRGRELLAALRPLQSWADTWLSIDDVPDENGRDGT